MITPDTEAGRHPVYPEGPPCNAYCPGEWSEYHDGYADGFARAEARRNADTALRALLMAAMGVIDFATTADEHGPSGKEVWDRINDYLRATPTAPSPEDAAPPNHPDDGHFHRFTCVRCGVDQPPPPEGIVKATPTPASVLDLDSRWLRLYDTVRYMRANVPHQHIPPCPVFEVDEALSAVAGIVGYDRPYPPDLAALRAGAQDRDEKGGG